MYVLVFCLNELFTSMRRVPRFGFKAFGNVHYYFSVSYIREQASFFCGSYPEAVALN